MIKPNFILGGAAKSGTTSLYSYLNQHSQVFMSPWKEPSFFSEVPGTINNWNDYLDLFKAAKNQKIIGEASTSYLFDKNAPEMIKGYLGKDVKFIFILRNPVDMVYSLWAYNVGGAAENLDFKDAIRLENERQANPELYLPPFAWTGRYAYTSRAKYSNQISRYIEIFGIEKIKVLIFEEFFSNTDNCFKDVCHFLEINDNESIDFKIYNEAATYRIKWLKLITIGDSTWRKKLRKFVPVSIRAPIKNLIKKINKKRQKLPPLSYEDRQELWDIFNTDVANLEKTLDRKLLNIWRP